MPANKILTVTYGAFSCTLEGFDDPVAALTEIADYFRDLADGDRHFGAEPQAPDLDRLREIAERRTEHAVGTQAENGSVTLRKLGGEEDEAGPPPADADSPDGRAEALVIPQDETVTDAGDIVPERSDDATHDGALPEACEALPEDSGAKEAAKDTFAADLAAILSTGAVDAEAVPDADAVPDAPGLPPTLRIRRVRRTDDASSTAAAIVTPPATPATRDGSEADGFDADSDGDILGILSFDEGAAEPDDVLSGDRTHDSARPAAPSVPDMERLFAATDSRLSGEDTSRRHANISHLKAAVAARRADGPAGPDDDTQTEAYRADLASSVRPRRAVRPVETSSAARPTRASPLMLVSEQRVGETPGEAAEPGAPVHPRRAARQDEGQHPPAKTEIEAEAFERFVVEQGATDVPDILEAAALYSARVTGEETFTRPALLHLAAEAYDELSREDGLRGFGQLLRDGRIRKVGRGTFALRETHRDATDRRTG